MVTRLHRDHLAGLVVILIGFGVLVQARRYDVGTLAHVGPGFMPLVLGALMAVTGLFIALGAGKGESAEGPTIHAGPDWRGWLCITVSVALFVGLANYAGLLPAIFCCVFVAAFGDRQARLGSSVLLAAGVTVFGVLLFSYGLKIPIPLVRGL